MPKILIIEDSKDIVELLRIRLVREGFTVVSAMEGYTGINIAKKEKPDLVILDLMLPAGDGLTVIKSLKMSPFTRVAPILVITGQSDEEYKQKVLDEGVDAYMQKPFDSTLVVEKVKELLHI